MSDLSIEKRDEMFTILCQLSDQQFDPQAKDKIKTWIGRQHEEIKYEMLGLLDDIACCSWSSSFKLKALHVIFEMIGGTILERDQQRIDYERAKNNKELQAAVQAKYNWIVPLF